MYKCSFKYFVCCSMLRYEACDAVDEAVEGDRDGVRDFVELKEVEEAAEE